MTEDDCSLQLQYANAVYQAARFTREAELTKARLDDQAHKAACEARPTEHHSQKTLPLHEFEALPEAKATFVEDIFRVHRYRAALTEGLYEQVGLRLGFHHAELNLIASTDQGKSKWPAIEEALRAERQRIDRAVEAFDQMLQQTRYRETA